MKRTIVRNAGAPEGVVVFNYRQAAGAMPKAADIPTLVSDSVLAGLTKDDPEPFFSVQAIKYPATGNGLRYGSVGIYEKAFFNSFINKTKAAPIPGSKFGHEFSPKPSNDFYMIGGMLVPNEADPKAGTAYFKMYIPPKGYTTDNYGFIRDARAGLVQYSLVAKPDYTVKPNAAGQEEYHFTGSLGSERNDAVSEGAMDQIVNGISLDLDAARALIESGQFDSSSNVEGEPIQNGRVYRSALRRLASRANEEDRSAIGELISLIDKAKNGRKNPMEDKQEAITLLSTLIANGREKITDIAKALGFGEKLRTDADVANAKAVETLTSKLGDKPFERLEAVLAENKATADLKVENAVREIAGEKTLKNAAGQPFDNPAHAYAAQKCAGLAGEELKNAVEALKKDPTMVALNGLRADGGSSFYKVAAGGGKGAVQNSDADDIPTTHVGGKE